MTTRPLSIDRVAAVGALALLALVLMRALGTVDPYWDTLQYHWPYAARAAGLCDSQCLALPPGIELRYTSFPKVYHFIFGWLWRVSGTPAAGHLIGISMVLAFCGYLRVRFRVPLAWSWLACLAIPLVQIHLTSSYADLTGNAAIALALLVAFRVWMEPEARSTIDVALALAALTLAAGTKLQLVPVTLVAWLLVTLAVVRSRRMARRSFPALLLLGLLALGGLCLTPQLVLNTLRFGNPFFPVEVHLGPWTLPGPETMTQQGMSIATPWARRPGWLRWLASVFEFDAYGGRNPPWTVDQGDVPNTSRAFRMGGYFAAYVLGLLTLVALRARLGGDTARPLAVVVVLGVLCALLPLSHELRYYQFWMLLLVAMALVLAFSPRFDDRVQAAYAVATRALICVALATVTLVTGAVYLRTGGSTFAQLAAPTNAVVDALPAGATLCVATNYRDAILYSSLFHPGHDLHVRAIYSGDSRGCTQVITPP